MTYTSIENILKYLDKHDDYQQYSDNFKNPINKNVYNILHKIISEDINIKNINISYLILNIFIHNNNDNGYLYYFDNKINKIKIYYYFINVLSIYISELLYEYINSKPLIREKILKDKKTKEESINIINIKLTEIKIAGIYYLLFLFNLLLINNNKLLDIYINFIFNPKSTSVLNVDYYNQLLIDFSSNIDEYFKKLKQFNINDNKDKHFNTILFNILNLNLIYSLVNSKNDQSSLLLIKEDDIDNLYKILKQYIPKKEVDINYNKNNIYSTLSKYLYIFFNE
jgi:hypothetical protein